MNLWDILILSAVVLVVIGGLFISRRRGGSSHGCSCGCDSCPISGSCSTKKDKPSEKS